MPGLHFLLTGDLFMKYLPFCLAAASAAFSLLFALSPAWALDDEAEDGLDADERIVVTAAFRPAELLDSAGSVSVITAETARQRQASHLETLLNLAPNVNYAAGASRGQFFQIRGVGERSQFVDPINPSVGLLMDGIDLTGLGGAATLLDLSQVEVLRGPQGTLMGANAMAGLINLVSAAPGDVISGFGEARLGQRGLREVQAAVGGPVGDEVGFRLAYGKTLSDGAQRNAFLGRSDTAHIDEQSLRGRLSWQLHPKLSLDLVGLALDIDNGYDGFSLDNTRTTLSDQPGHDRQDTLAGAAHLRWQARPALDVELSLTRLSADLEYGFDADWAFVGLCDVFDCLFPGYSAFDNYERSQDNTTVDLRAVSAAHPDRPAWVLGAYYRDQSQFLRREFDFLPVPFERDFDTVSRALYGQVDWPLAGRWQLQTGLRYERRRAHYSDSDGAEFRPGEGMWGGRLGLEYRAASGQLFYGLVSRGYKAGGVNSNSAVPLALREFQTETLLNYELGTKGRLLDDRLDLRAALFWQDRTSLQTQQALLLPQDGVSCPCEFVQYTANATAGQSYGLETELTWRARPDLLLFGSLGLMRSGFDGFENFSHVDADPDNGVPFDMDGRDLPHAPEYMFAVGAVFQLADGWSIRAEYEGKDAFFFSSRHEVRAPASRQLHARLAYQVSHWELALWGRNLTNEDVQVRGFGAFGNDPRKGYIIEPYVQYAEPRTLGISARYDF
ncbi:MAG: TonB-dependent receptor [Wenzhouxiangella sp.]|nr:MAG: TonB-dependent receptor [Wenzhouxiangella sp.]